MRWLDSVLRSGIVTVLSGCISNPTPHPERRDDATTANVSDSAGGGGSDTGGFAEAGDDTTPEPAPDVFVPDDDGDASDALDSEDAQGPGDADGADGNGGDDADAADSDAISATSLFPPEERAVVVREVLVRDLDGDGADDLIVASVPEDASAWGLYVFFDAARNDYTASDLFIPTEPIPDGVLVADVHGDARPELVVFGRRGDQGVVEVYPFAARAPGMPLRIEAPFVPAGGVTPISGAPVGVAVGRFDPDAVHDLIVFDLYNLWAFSTRAWSAESIRVARWTSIQSDEPWGAILRVFVVDHDGDGWLVVPQEYGKTHFFPLGDDGLDPNDVVVDTGLWQLGTTFADLEGDTIPELVGFAGVQLNVRTFAPPQAGAWRFPNQMPIPGNGLDDLLALDVDDSGTPDFVMLEHAEAGDVYRLHVARDVELFEGDVRTAPWRQTSLGIGQGAYRLAAVGSGDALRIWAFELGGRARCFAWDETTSQLARCP